MLTGVDVSRFQHPDGAHIDYAAAVHAGVGFAVVEYRDEASVPNPYFEADWRGFADAGAGVGSYVFARPDLAMDPQAEDLRILSQHGPIWCDLEVLDGMRPAEVLRWWDELRVRVPIVNLWTYPAFLTGTTITVSTDELALDDWGVKDPARPCAIWGMTSSERVNGILALVDLDAWMLGQARFEVAFRKTPPVRERVGPIVGMAAYPAGSGYWLVNGHGAVYPFGNAAFHGSLEGLELPAPVTGITATKDGAGYWLWCADGEVHQFGDARFEGSIPKPRREPARRP